MKRFVAMLLTVLLLCSCAPATPTPVPEKRTIRLAVGGAVYAPKAVRQSAQNGSGYDFSAAYAMLGGFGGGELALSAIIKHGENKQINRYEKEKDKHD